jgi:hypothetical protein
LVESIFLIDSLGGIASRPWIIPGCRKVLAKETAVRIRDQHHSKLNTWLEAALTGSQDGCLYRSGGTLPSVPVRAASSRQFGATGAKMPPKPRRCYHHNLHLAAPNVKRAERPGYAFRRTGPRETIWNLDSARLHASGIARLKTTRTQSNIAFRAGTGGRHSAEN